MTSSSVSIVVLGGGPAGVGAAYRLASRGGFTVTVVERNPGVGGNAGSFELEGQPVDFGSHRLHPSCAPEILADIRSLVGGDLLDRPRHGRIRLRSRWVHFPLKPLDLAVNLPPSFALGALRDSVFKPRVNGEDTFASVLERGLGRTICRDFYFPYARKIWGQLPAELDAEQARRRVAAGSVGKLLRKVMKAVPGVGSGGARFYYPRAGFGQISEAYGRAATQRGARILLRTSVERLVVEQGRVVAVDVRGPEGPERLPASFTISTIPIALLARMTDPPPPVDIVAAARALRARAMILVYLVLDTDRFTEFDAHYFPDADIAITRLSEPKNYGLAGQPGRTVLCAELPCNPDDEVWTHSDQALGDLVVAALARAELPVRVPVRLVAARRLREAYPIYTREFRRHFERLDGWVSSIGGLVTLGRQGLFAHDNTHHTLAMAYAASACLGPGGSFDAIRWADHRRAFESHVVED